MQPRSQFSCQCDCICLVDVPAAISLKRLKVICATAILHIASMGNQSLQLHVTLPANAGVGPPPFPPAPPAPEPTVMFPVRLPNLQQLLVPGALPALPPNLAHVNLNMAHSIPGTPVPSMPGTATPLGPPSIPGRHASWSPLYDRAHANHTA